MDLELGDFIMVPYAVQEGQAGNALLRILAERDEVTGKTPGEYKSPFSYSFKHLSSKYSLYLHVSYLSSVIS